MSNYSFEVTEICRQLYLTPRRLDSNYTEYKFIQNIFCDRKVIQRFKEEKPMLHGKADVLVRVPWWFCLTKLSPSQKRLRQLNLFSLERRRLRADLILDLKIFQGVIGRSQSDFFPPPTPNWAERAHQGPNPLRRRIGAFSVRVFWRL